MNVGKGLIKRAGKSWKKVPKRDEALLTHSIKRGETTGGSTHYSKLKQFRGKMWVLSGSGNVILRVITEETRRRGSSRKGKALSVGDLRRGRVLTQPPDVSVKRAINT